MKIIGKINGKLLNEMEIYMGKSKNRTSKDFPANDGGFFMPGYAYVDYEDEGTATLLADAKCDLKKDPFRGLGRLWNTPNSNDVEEVWGNGLYTYIIVYINIYIHS